MSGFDVTARCADDTSLGSQPYQIKDIITRLPLRGVSEDSGTSHNYVLTNRTLWTSRAPGTSCWALRSRAMAVLSTVSAGTGYLRYSPGICDMSSMQTEGGFLRKASVDAIEMV